MSLLDTASLLLTPNAYKEGKLYSVIPSDGTGDFTFTRATTATRMNSNGLVELVPYNLLQRSEEFDNAYWTKVNTTVTANSTTAPDGTLTADNINPNNGVNFNISASGYFTCGTSSSLPTTTSINLQTGTYTFSFFAKQNGLRYIQPRIATASNLTGTTLAAVVIDLQDELVVLGDGTSIVNITNYANGFARYEVTFSVTSAQNCYVGFWWWKETSGIVDGTIGYVLWGTQLVEGSTAKDYQKTETRLNIPRLDYSNGTCPSILLEPQRTNLLLQSSSFDNVYWAKTNATIIANSTTAPDGTTTADTITPNITNGFHYARAFNLTTAVNSYTYSIYAKANGYNFIGIQLASNVNFTNYFEGVFNLSNGTIETTGRAVGFSGTRSITALGNGWYRCSISITNATSSSTALVSINPQSTNDPSITYSGDGTSGVYIWGAQLEAGSYATSYIPTTTASVTRNQDVCNKTGISSLIGQSEGVLFVDFEMNNFSGTTVLISPHDGAANKRVELWTNNNILNGFIGASVSVNLGSQTITAGRHKAAVAYKSGDSAFYIDGTQIGTSTTAFTIAALTTLSFAQYTGSLIPNASINQAALWKTRLTNDQLAQLTSL